MKKTILIFTLSAMALGNIVFGAEKFTLKSKSFKNNGVIPLIFTKLTGGKNRSPQLSWSNPPAGTKSFVITCIDINPVAKRWVHWTVINIPAKVNSIAESASNSKMPKETMELSNSFGSTGWGGPKPPAHTGVHQYVFTIYALKVEVIKPQRKFLTENMLLRLLKINGKILAQASIIGTCKNE